jgi:hypothetical protein
VAEERQILPFEVIPDSSKVKTNQIKGGILGKVISKLQ